MSSQNRPAGRPTLILIVGLMVAACSGAGSTLEPSVVPTPGPTPTDVPGPTGNLGTASPAPEQPSPTPEPVILHSTGTATLALTDLPAFVATATDDTLACDSGPDAMQVVGVTALDLGELDGATVRGQLHPGSGANDPGALELFIDGGDLTEGSFQPFWHGSGTFEAGADGLTGQAVFSGLTLETDPKLPNPDPRWPATLSGTITWSCSPFAAIDPVPGSSSILLTAPPPSATAGG
ncbi:MAG: hypothetical protein ABIV26_06965 [Candidatus Limnocylindrales bacterium]